MEVILREHVDNLGRRGDRDTDDTDGMGMEGAEVQR